MADRLGRLFAERGVGCVCGAGKEGLMGRLADSVLASGGKAIGVIPAFMVERGWVHPALTETIVTTDIHSRKKRMAELSDATIALPGGCGTMEELLEIITWKQLGLYSKPIVILNSCGYYDPLVAMLRRAIEEQFMRPSQASLWLVVGTAEEAMDLLDALPDSEKEAESKYDE